VPQTLYSDAEAAELSLPSCLVRHKLGNWLPVVTPESNVDLVVLVQGRLQLTLCKCLQFSKCISFQSSGNC